MAVKYSSTIKTKEEDCYLQYTRWRHHTFLQFKKTEEEAASARYVEQV